MAAATTEGAPGGRSRKFFGQVTFTPSKRGYEQVEVDAFLEQAGHAIERLLQRLREAESVAGQAQLQIESAEQRAQQAELQASSQQGDEDLIQRTLSLAERTAVAAVADAKRRAEEILQEANLEAATVFGLERRQLEDEGLRMTGERQQLEALRLAVAAETHALDQVRANLRDRVAAVANELQAVADAPDLLGYRLASPATPTDSAPVAEPQALAPAAPALPQAPVAAPEPMPEAVVATPPPLPEPIVAPPPPAAEPPVLAPSVAVAVEPPAESAPEPFAASASSIEVPGEVRAEVPPGWPYAPPPAEPTVEAAPAAPAAPSAPSGHGASVAKSFEAQWEQESVAADPAADQAFAQFFSDKVEQDPSQSWILAAEAS